MRWVSFRRKSGPTGDSPTAQAAYWISRAELGLLRRDEQSAFDLWRQEPRNEAALAELRAMLSEVHRAACEPGIARMRSEALDQAGRGPLLLGNVPVSMAAAILGGFALVLLLGRGSDRPVSPPEAARQADVYETRKGERRLVTLADGSLLTLNTESRVEAMLVRDRRTVRLVRGQALFQVAKDKERPFAVIAGPLEVTALGTQFDVQIDGGQAKVVLVEGRIRVEPLARHGVGRLLPMLDRHYLKPGEQLVVEKAQDKISVDVADVEQSTSWQHGRLVFRGEPLESAVAEFNRYTERQLAVADPRLAHLPVSGVFSVSRPENFLAAVASFYPVRIEERSPRLSILTLREP